MTTSAPSRSSTNCLIWSRPISRRLCPDARQPPVPNASHPQSPIRSCSTSQTLPDLDPSRRLQNPAHRRVPCRIRPTPCSTTCAPAAPALGYVGLPLAPVVRDWSRVAATPGTPASRRLGQQGPGSAPRSADFSRPGRRTSVRRGAMGNVVKPSLGAQASACRGIGASPKRQAKACAPRGDQPVASQHWAMGAWPRWSFTATMLLNAPPPAQRSRFALAGSQVG